MAFEGVIVQNTYDLRPMQDFFFTGTTKSLAYRKEQLQALYQMMVTCEDELVLALKKDLGKSRFEAYVAEIGFLKGDIKHTLANFKKWAKPTSVPTPLLHMPASAEIRYEPRGVSLIIGAWNYPVQLTLAPLVAAIGAGCPVVLKPSELAGFTSACLADIIPKFLDPRLVKVVEGDARVASALLDQPFDHIFFTGGTHVGKIVMEKAAKNLSSVTLELGGKSPCIINEDANIAVTAKRIAWGKWLNAGQTCIAPDYVLIHDKVHDQFLSALKSEVTKMYGEDPEKSADYGRIINQRHFERILKLIDKGKVHIGGESNPKTRYLAPTVLKDVDYSDAVMAEEIFGPVLPVIRVKSMDEALEHVKHEKPLALYLFSESKAFQEKALMKTRSGAACINETITHVANPDLPFGGIGSSGFGAYHGHDGFLAFTHKRSVVKKTTKIDLPLRYPPYQEKVLKLVRLFQ